MSMTRLVKSDVQLISREMAGYDDELRSKTGMTLLQVAARAAGMPEALLAERAATALTAVVPITAGEGLIEYFTQAVCGIACHLGCRGYITGMSDVAGFAEALDAGADLLFMADDRQFVAYNRRSGALIDNGAATGRGFVAALEGMAGGLRDKPVLVLGAGPVGRAALRMLREIGAVAAVFDIDLQKAEQAAEESGAVVEGDLKQALGRYRYIVEATPQGAFIDCGDYPFGTMISLPGMPLGLTAAAYAELQPRTVHDPLQIGVAAMLAMAVAEVAPSKG
jgi:pyrrolysine biosynthesis protein PylD